MACAKQDIIQMKNPEDIARYIRCNLLVGQVLTPIFREYMHLNNIPPASVYKTITAKWCDNFRKKLSQKEMGIVQTLLSDGYNKFDITLMYKIARNNNFKMIITELPTRGWGTEPLPHEITIGDDIERIRLSRDHLMHSPSHLVSETEFILFFDKLVDVTRRADEHNNKADSIKYEQQIQDLRFYPIDPENEKILLETLEENKNLKEVMQLQLFPVYMTEEVVQIFKDIQSGTIKMDGTVQLKLIVEGTENPTSLKDNINSHRGKIGMKTKDCLIKLDKASEGSLILYLEVQKGVFQSESLLHAEMDRFLENVFKVIHFKPEITIASRILITHDDRYEIYSSSEDEDDPSVEMADKKLVLNITVKNEAFQTDELFRQNLNSFVETLVKDMNGQEIKKDDNLTAVLRLNEADEDEGNNIPLKMFDKKSALHHAAQHEDVQTNQYMHQIRSGEKVNTELNSQQDQRDDGVTTGFKLNDSDYSVTSHRSVFLYQYLCQNIVGSDDYVKMKRMMNASNDRLFSPHGMTQITIGSIGEGLELQGSDLKIMFVPPQVEITENIHQHLYGPNKTIFLLDTNDVKPGFAHLRLVVNNDMHYLSMCQHFEGQLYLSSVVFQNYYFPKFPPITYTPCLSNSDGNVDLLVCLHSKFWVSNAVEWITRNKTNAWPSPEVKQNIIDHGVMCVPVGKRGTIDNELIWRISFSVSEKFLCYSFTHTQLVCYALLKMYLKDVIIPFTGYNNLLCSYIIKTILFWICEESPESTWKPANLIPCFMRCIKRLLYCVEYSICPNYFIPEINLFENWINRHERTLLLNVLNSLIEYEWRSICFIQQLYKVQLPTRIHINPINSDYFVDSLEKLTQSKPFNLFPFGDFIHYKEQLRIILSSMSEKTKLLMLYNMTKQCGDIAGTISSSSRGNKSRYQQYKQCICLLLQSTQHDCVSGWLMLATLFYQNKQYYIAVFILSYARSKFTTEKMIPGSNMSEKQRELLHLDTFRNLGLIRSLRIAFSNDICFQRQSCLLPVELQSMAAPYLLLQADVYCFFDIFVSLS